MFASLSVKKAELFFSDSNLSAKQSIFTKINLLRGTLYGTHISCFNTTKAYSRKKDVLQLH